MTKFVFFVCGFIIVIVGQVVVNAGGSGKSDAESTLAIAASASEIANNAHEIKNRKKNKGKSKHIVRNKRQSFTNNGLMGFGEDIEMMKHDKSILSKKIENRDVMPGDIVACLTKNGRTQHYAIAIDGEGSTVGFGYDIGGVTKTDVFGFPFGNVKGYFEYLKADNLSESYKNKCAVFRNAFNTHYLNVDNNSTCFGKLDLAFKKWSNILAARINNITSLKLKYNFLECNCQIIGLYLAYGFLNKRVNCITENGDKILQYRYKKPRTNIGEVNDAYIDYYLECRE